MPIMEYNCKQCNRTFEVLHTWSERRYNTRPCPSCDNMAVKIPSLNNFLLKGGGWEKDGYQKTG